MRGQSIGAVATAALLLGPMMADTARAQETLVAAKDLYASAAYHEALSALDRLKSTPPPPDQSLEIEKYRAYCLLALGRTADAEASIAAIVAADPLSRQDDTQASPRVVAAFRAVRRRLLPSIAHENYTTAKAAFDEKDYAQAAKRFRRVLAILDDPDWSADGSFGADMKTLAAGFLDLSVAADRQRASQMEPANSSAEPPSGSSEAQVPPGGSPAIDPAAGASNNSAASPSTATTTAAAPAAVIYGTSDRDVTPPVVLRQVLPAWPTSLPTSLARVGSLEVVIDEDGRVEASVVRQSINAVYDGLVLQAVRQWRYRPAQREGRPVKFRKRIEISYKAVGSGGDR